MNSMFTVSACFFRGGENYMIKKIGFVANNEMKMQWGSSVSDFLNDHFLSFSKMFH